MHTLTEIATHWGTWSGVGASIVGIAGWFLARAGAGGVRMIRL